MRDYVSRRLRDPGGIGIRRHDPARSHPGPQSLNHNVDPAMNTPYANTAANRAIDPPAWKRVSWGAIVAGVVIAIVVQMVRPEHDRSDALQQP